LHRVFPGPVGGCLTYWDWRSRYFRPALIRLGLPIVTPHSARHGFISALQANGAEVGLVATLAGHANPAVTLGHYTHAVRKGDTAIASLEDAYLKAGGQ
jgi:integrase